MSDLATLYDPVHGTSVDFMMDGDWQPSVHEEGSLHYPKGWGFATKLTDGTKGIGGQFTLVSTNEAMDDLVETLMQVSTPLVLTLPNGDVYNINLDPASDRTGTVQFSLMLWQYVNKWTVIYAQAA